MFLNVLDLRSKLHESLQKYRIGCRRLIFWILTQLHADDTHYDSQQHPNNDEKRENGNVNSNNGKSIKIDDEDGNNIETNIIITFDKKQISSMKNNHVDDNDNDDNNKNMNDDPKPNNIGLQGTDILYLTGGKSDSTTTTTMAYIENPSQTIQRQSTTTDNGEAGCVCHYRHRRKPIHLL